MIGFGIKGLRKIRGLVFITFFLVLFWLSRLERRIWWVKGGCGF